jgi:hypothetical protein
LFTGGHVTDASFYLLQPASITAIIPNQAADAPRVALVTEVLAANGDAEVMERL